MKTQIASFLFRHRRFLQRLIPVRHPILLRLKDFAIYVRLTDWAVGARIAVLRTHEAHVTKAILLQARRSASAYRASSRRWRASSL